MWKQYFDESSQTEINIESRFRLAIMEKINQSQINEFLFEDAKQIVYNLLRFSILPLWRASPLFKEAIDSSGLAGLNMMSLENESGNKKKDDMNDMNDMDDDGLNDRSFEASMQIN